MFKTANEIKPFDLTRRLRIDPTRLDPIRATNLLRFPERSVARPLTSHDAIRTKLLFAESVHEDVVQRRSKQPGGPDLYRDQRYLSTQVKAKRCENIVVGNYRKYRCRVGCCLVSFLFLIVFSVVTAFQSTSKQVLY